MLLSLMLYSAPSMAIVPNLEVEQGAEPKRIVHTHVERQYVLRQGQPWQSFIAGEGSGWQATFDEWTGTPRKAWGPGLELGPTDTQDQVVQGLLALVDRSPLFAVDSSQLQLRDAGYIAHTDTWYVHLDRVVGGVVVWRGGVNAIIKQGRLIMMAVDTHPQAGISGDLPPLEQSQAILAAQEQGPASWAQHTDSSARLVLLPEQVGSSSMRYRLVWETRSRTQDPPGIWVSMVDARTGELLHFWNEVRFLKGEVSAMHHLRNPGDSLVESAMVWAPVYGEDGTVYTDVLGQFQADGSEFGTDLDGSYLDVRNSAGAEAEAEFQGDSFLWTSARATQAELDSYVFLHQIQAWGSIYAPSISIVRSGLRSTVNINSSCNAYYDGNVNFYQASSADSCNNTGEIADVNYHEWGHGFHATSRVSGSVDGDMGEGIGDVVAFLQTNDAVMARYFFENGAGIREVATDLVYPADYRGGDVHHNGLMFGGSAWDLLKLLEEDMGLGEAQRLSSELLAGAVKSGPLLTDAYDAYLAADDDNGDLSDGTPHTCYLLDAFTPHGLGPGGTDLLIQAAFDPVDNQPAGTTAYSVQGQATNLAPACTPDPQSAWLAWQVGDAAWQESALAFDPQLRIEGEIPAQESGSILRYYLGFEGGEDLAFAPSGGVINPSSFLVGPTETLYFQDFEDGDGGYSHELISGDSGQGADDWWAGTPAGLGGDPAYCYSGDTCWGNDLGGDHEGATWNGTYQAEKHNRLSSPQIEVPEGEGQLFLQFRRWLNVEDGQYDQAQVLVDGEVVWTNYDASSTVEDEDHVDMQWALETIAIDDVNADGLITISWDLTTDAGKQLGGWTLDDVAVLRLTQGDSEPDDSDPDQEPEVSLELVGSGNCGCTSTAPTPGMLLGLLAMMASVLMMRRRR